MCTVGYVLSYFFSCVEIHLQSSILRKVICFFTAFSSSFYLVYKVHTDVFVISAILKSDVEATAVYVCITIINYRLLNNKQKIEKMTALKRPNMYVIQILL